MNIDVGSKFWFVSSERRKGLAVEQREIEVTKVGKRWAYFGTRERFDIESCEVDGGVYNSPGRIYESQQAYLAFFAADTQWRRFVSLVNEKYHVREGVSEVDVLSAATILKIDMS